MNDFYHNTRTGLRRHLNSKEREIINEYTSPKELRRGIKDYINRYNYERPHSEHGNDYPSEVYGRPCAT